VDNELQFRWPDTFDHPVADDAISDDSRLLARRRRGRAARAEAPSDEWQLQQELDRARETIARLEADRSAARTHIGELEAANDALEFRVTAQRRRLLVLERQLEDADVQPAWQSEANASWLDRLFGGLSSVPTG
jgi:chromosome segregation ATPase